jgi:hypothetical protein
VGTKDQIAKLSSIKKARKEKTIKQSINCPRILGRGEGLQLYKYFTETAQ